MSANFLIDSAPEYEKRVCRLTEQIWGNCEKAPTAGVSLVDVKSNVINNLLKVNIFLLTLKGEYNEPI